VKSILIESARIKGTNKILMQYELANSHRLASQKKDIICECIICNQILKVTRKNNTIFFSHKTNESQNCYLTNQTCDEKELIKKTNNHILNISIDILYLLGYNNPYV
jgi:stress response protein SCP2